MCRFAVEDQGIGYAIDLFFSMIGCAVDVFGIYFAIIVIGFVPIYIFLFIYWRNELSLRSPWVCCRLGLWYFVDGFLFLFVVGGCRSSRYVGLATAS